MITYTRTATTFLTHARPILGGIVMAFALVATIGVVAGLFQWEFTRAAGTILGFLAVAISAFVVSKWHNGNLVDGLIVGCLFTWISLILFQQAILARFASQSLLGVLLLFFVAPLPLGMIGLIGGLIGQLLRKNRSKRITYTIRCLACGYRNAPSLKSCGRCGQALPQKK